MYLSCALDHILNLLVMFKLLTYCNRNGKYNTFIKYSVERKITKKATSWNIVVIQNEWLLENTYSTSTLSWLKFLSYWNQSIALHCKSIDWFLYDKDLHHEWVETLRRVCLIINCNDYPKTFSKEKIWHIHDHVCQKIKKVSDKKSWQLKNQWKKTRIN